MDFGDTQNFGMAWAWRNAGVRRAYRCRTAGDVDRWIVRRKYLNLTIRDGMLFGRGARRYESVHWRPWWWLLSFAAQHPHQWGRLAFLIT